MKTRFQAFALAGVLAATALTGGAAVLGLSHWGSQAPTAAPATATVVPTQAATFHETEGAD